MSETIAVFIDGDNISPKDIDEILAEIYDYGNIIIKRVYLDWTLPTSQGWSKATRDYGLEPIQCDLIKGKNSTDIKLTVDIMRTLYCVSHISLFYLVTQDGDFRHIIPEIKINNRSVNVIGKNVSKALGACCDKYTSLDVLSNKKNIGDELYGDNGNGNGNVKVKVDINKKTLDNEGKYKDGIIKYKDGVEKYKDDIEKLLEKNGTVSLSLIKDTLQRKYQFDQREYGFQQFSKFMEFHFPEYQVYKMKEGCFISFSEK